MCVSGCATMMSMYDRTMTTKTSGLAAALRANLKTAPGAQKSNVVDRMFTELGDDADEFRTLLLTPLSQGGMSPEEFIMRLKVAGGTVTCAPVTLRRWVNEQRMRAGLSA